MEADVVFLSLARDCARTLPIFFDFTASLRDSGMRCAAIIGENGSRDATKDLLRTAQAGGHVVAVSTDFMAQIPDRLQRMAVGRQHLKEQLEKSSWTPRFVCIVDLDNAFEQPPTPASFSNAIAKLEHRGVFAVSATSRPLYYDLLAFEDGSISFEFLLDEIESHQTNLFAYYRFFRDHIDEQRRLLTSPTDRQCTSAFNGLCLYPNEAYALGSYIDAASRRCEHLTFNRRVAAATGLQMLIDRELVLKTPSDHNEEAFVPFVIRRLRKRLRL
ncbi:glycosyltransferase family 2 protein [Lichenihabitans psoromatis]|uniref:glycosyltransferase family 2 protein n=1 Tax=Lichenihabitans psoromatis TaxID=2528642 RepID=UPI00103646C3|nr:glycosyltransferase family 2 protein [Lichenihabitans psoromatis]